MSQHTAAESQSQQLLHLIDRIAGIQSIARLEERTPVGIEESILPQILAYADEFKFPDQIDISYIVRSRWRADVPLYGRIRRGLKSARSRFRALCAPDRQVSESVDGGIPRILRPDAAYVRTAWSTLPEFVVLDRRIALVKTRVDHNYALVMRVAVPEIVESLTELFDRNWDLALCPRQYERLKRALRNPVNRKVLEQLQAGCIDEVAAKRMEISVRTYRRHLALFMAELEVESRFQMAWRLAQLQK